jgi:hypothetical protein
MDVTSGTVGGAIVLTVLAMLFGQLCVRFVGAAPRRPYAVRLCAPDVLCR